MEKRIIKDHINYSITDTGIVTNEKTGRTLKPQNNGNGYLYINLGRNNRKYIHRLVLETYMPNENSARLEVDHIDTDKSNNHLDNLRWTTRIENVNNKLTLMHNKESHSGEKGAMFGKFGKDNPSSKAIIGVNVKDGSTISFDSLTQAKEEKGYNQSNISACISGKQKTAYGYKWSFK